MTLWYTVVHMAAPLPRGVKTKEEIGKIKKACTITDTIFSRLISRFTEFETEKDIADFLQAQFRNYRVKPSFKPIVAAGHNAAHPHHVPTTAVLSGFVVIDFGVVYQGYCSDMTRTVYVGRPSRDERALYKKVLDAFEEARFSVLPGASCKGIDRVARMTLGPSLAKEFIHSLGHGVGKRIHEFPKISPRSNFYIREGMVITIEPGVYRKKSYGIRIEDTCVVVEKGCLSLSKSPKDLIVL